MNAIDAPGLNALLQNARPSIGCSKWIAWFSGPILAAISRIRWEISRDEFSGTFLAYSKPGKIIVTEEKSVHKK